jgi:hypothetical protein
LPNLLSLSTCCVCLEPRPLPSAGVTQLHRYYGPIRHPRMPGLSVTGVRLVVPDHPWGFPCCARFPCVHAATTTPAQRLCSYLLNPTVVSIFPDSVVGSICASSFSRFARCSLALRPAHSRRHQFVTLFTRRLQPYRYLHDRSGCYWLEPWPGGTYTHRKAPPLHGAHARSDAALKAVIETSLFNPPDWLVCYA